MIDDDEARVFGDRYVLGAQLTAGAEREVWQAHDDVVSRAVALKIFFGDTAADLDWQATFRRSADRLGALSHPGIAKVYDHGETADETWLAMALIPGVPLAERIDAGLPLSAHDALDVIGQTALALAAAHDAGVAHGSISPAAIMVREGGSIALIGFAVDGTATREGDIDALGALAATLFDSADATAPDITAFVTSLSDPTRAAKDRDAKEIGRTALALAATVGDVPSTLTTPVATSPKQAEPSYKKVGYGGAHDVAEKRMVRNRLIVLGTIVVVGGAALLRFVGEGAGDVTVPSLTNLTLDQAALKLTTGGLRTKDQCIIGKDSGGVVVHQSPHAGIRVKAGSVVTLTYTQDVC